MCRATVGYAALIFFQYTIGRLEMIRYRILCRMGPDDKSTMRRSAEIKDNFPEPERPSRASFVPNGVLNNDSFSIASVAF
jgi:hypothetical protein